MRARLAKGTIWISGARFCTNLFGLASTFILARLLVPADFGLVALSATMLAVLASVTNLSLSSALIQHREPTPQHFHTAWTLNLIRAVIIAGLFAAAGPLAAKAYDEPRIAAVMAALSLGVVFEGLVNPRSIMLTKDLVFWQQFMLEVTKKLAAVVVSIVIAIWFRSYWALVLGTLAGQAVSTAISYGVLPFRPKPSFRHGRELLSFSVWVTLGQVVTTVNWRFDHLLVGSFLGRTELGYYSVGNTVANIPTRESTTPLTATLFPAFSRLQDQPARLAAAYQSVQALVTAVALPMGVGVALIAEPLIRLTMGEKWVPATPVVQVLSVILALQTLGTLSQPLAMATGQNRLQFTRAVQGLAVKLPLIALGLYLWGLPGVLAGRALSGIMDIFLGLDVVRRVAEVSIRKQLAANVRSLASVAVMAGAVVGLHELQLFGVSPLELILAIASDALAGAVVYVGTHALLWLLAGRPAGPETEALRAAEKIAARFGLRPKPPAPPSP